MRVYYHCFLVYFLELIKGTVCILLREGAMNLHLQHELNVEACLCLSDELFETIA